MGLAYETMDRMVAMIADEADATDITRIMRVLIYRVERIGSIAPLELGERACTDAQRIAQKRAINAFRHAMH